MLTALSNLSKFYKENMELREDSVSVTVGGKRPLQFQVYLTKTLHACMHVNAGGGHVIYGTECRVLIITIAKKDFSNSSLSIASREIKKLKLL